MHHPPRGGSIDVREVRRLAIEVHQQRTVQEGDARFHVRLRRVPADHGLLNTCLKCEMALGRRAAVPDATHALHNRLWHALQRAVLVEVEEVGADLVELLVPEHVRHDDGRARGRTPLGAIRRHRVCSAQTAGERLELAVHHVVARQRDSAVMLNVRSEAGDVHGGGRLPRPSREDAEVPGGRAQVLAIALAAQLQKVEAPRHRRDDARAAEAIVHVVGILDSVGILNVRSEDRALSP
mmetsp:Transcript_12201/g.31803  ORF Transcript_12201/g.31803 Transcript_12201/m.31803 type:complete len:238 (+) Transcript_12201:203-916(+)